MPLEDIGATTYCDERFALASYSLGELLDGRGLLIDVLLFLVEHNSSIAIPMLRWPANSSKS
jgi:hypothetical protein